MMRKIEITAVAVAFCFISLSSCAGDSGGESIAKSADEDAVATESSEDSVAEAETGESDIVEADSDVMDNEAPICPECGSENVLRIIYGKPSQELVEKAERGEVKLGGCVVSRESPVWYCKECGTEW